MATSNVFLINSDVSLREVLDRMYTRLQQIHALADRCSTSAENDTEGSLWWLADDLVQQVDELLGEIYKKASDIGSGEGENHDN